MEDTNQQPSDRFTSSSSPGERAIELHNAAEQPILPQEERTVSANPLPGTAIPGASRSENYPVTAESGAFSAFYPFSSYSPQEQGLYYAGYDNNSGGWVEQSNDVSANNMHLAMYNDNPSLFFPPSYGFDAQMAFGQFSPIANPQSPVMIDGQLYSQHQIPVSPPYYPPPLSPGLPHVTSGLPASQTDLVAPGSSGNENLFDSTGFGPGSGYYIPFGSFGGGELSGNSNLGFYYQGEYGSGESLSNRPSSLDSGRYMSQLAAAAMYPQQVGILGSYDQNAMQASYQGLGFAPGSSTRQYAQGGPYLNANYGSGSSSLWETGHRNRLTDKGGRRERDRQSVSISTESIGISSERNRGPRALKPKSKCPIEESSSSGIHKEVESTSSFQLEQYNRPEFVTDYEHAKFFVIKSYSEDNVHRSIKYSVWASTPLGNRKLDAAYREAKEMNANCPVFLFFSVNASGQFCGVSEMVGPVDFENSAEYWQQDRWSGQFPVKWHVIKDVPNSQFRHILLDNNDNKPVTHSRDSQEVKLEQGLEILKIFKNYDADTSILDDFTFYDEREKSFLERKTKQQTIQPGSAAATNAAEPVSQLADDLAGTLNLEGN